MPERIRAAGILAIVLALIAYAYSPLLTAGFLGEDLAVISALDAVSGPADWYRVDGTQARPGAALLLLASRAAWTADGLWSGSEALVLRRALLDCVRRDFPAPARQPRDENSHAWHRDTR